MKIFTWCIVFLLFINLFIFGVENKMTEIFEDGFYRAPAGKAVLQLPELDDTWQVRLEAPDNFRHLILIKGLIKNSFEQRITISFPLSMNKIVGAKDMATSLATQAQKNGPFLKLIKHGPIRIKGGSCYSIILMGEQDNGQGYMYNSYGISSDTYSMFISVEMLSGNFESLTVVVNGIFETLAIGENVPRLKDLKPGVRLHGVYKGPGKAKWDGSWEEYWLIFDKRGYYIISGPHGALETDFEARFQQNKRYINRYNIKGSKFIKTDTDGNVDDYPVTINNETITLFGRTYVLVSGKSDGMKLDGHYEAYYYYETTDVYSDFSFSSSANYYFTKDGKFSFASFASAHTNVDENLDGYKGTVDVNSDVRNKSGAYVIQDDHIILTFNNGKKAVKTFYTKYYKDKKPGAIFINGTSYLLD
jgi:hypothetical protein